ncbi:MULTISPECIES: GNAT family N-acetyltransferase [Pacificibacter]|uniref:GNAT family N-acetyltransferase n=1 Tax=Pacificibacter TaxID=1042323 RepID=UPI001C0826E4|nr:MULTISPECIES: GNAT family N-acetyltransferase [Pacificibacter]MBU2937824.1 GNAT family N-acetyltransferase [Pacificibacter marinus]MDO6616085.1 GNAT family N-acetyltransferase [Pacificibacter sp. 1_MG-2023]
MIRAAIPADMESIAALQIASWRGAYQGLLSDAYLGQPVVDDLRAKWVGMDVPAGNVLLVSDTDGVVDGFIYVMCDRTPTYIDNLHVSPTRKRGGIGEALMRAAAKRLIDLGHSAVSLTVITDNHPAVAFYDKMGGMRGPAQDEKLYGEPVQTYPVTWDDLQALAQ